MYTPTLTTTHIATDIVASTLTESNVKKKGSIAHVYIRQSSHYPKHPTKKKVFRPDAVADRLSLSR
jgi:hypothetical protein